MESKVYGVYESPIGKMFIYIDRGKLSYLGFKKLSKKDFRPCSKDKVLISTINQLKLYFEGKLKKFDLPLSLEGTKFQKQTWNVLQKIPYGKTWSYKKEAEKLGDAKKARAVGSANGKNPIPIIIPCHRVISSNGDLGGYSSGLSKKRFLLSLESAP